MALVGYNCLAHVAMRCCYDAERLIMHLSVLAPELHCLEARRCWLAEEQAPGEAHGQCGGCWDQQTEPAAAVSCGPAQPPGCLAGAPAQGVHSEGPSALLIHPSQE